MHSGYLFQLVVDRMAQTLFNNAAHVKEDSSSAGEETGPDLKEENDSSMKKEDGPGGSEVTEQRSDAEAKEKEPNEGIRDNSGAVHGEGSNNGNTNGDSEKRLETERRERESVLTEEERIQRKDESGKIKNEVSYVCTFCGGVPCFDCSFCTIYYGLA